MKVLAINGSPNPQGNTAFALQTVLNELEKYGIQTEIANIGRKVIRGCAACGSCLEQQDRRCFFDDEVNAWLPKLTEADGILLGSPVYYSGINGTIKSFLDRAFFVASNNGWLMRHKVGAGVVVARRSGGTASCEQLNKYFMISEMVVVSASYWNIVHGLLPGEAGLDEEGISTMRILGRNMAWIIQTLDQKQIERPPIEERVFTHFIR